MFTHSIRWRFQFWLGFLLLCVLSGFGFSVYQLQRIHQLQQVDRELQLRVTGLNFAVRRPGPFDSGRGRPPFDRRGPGDAPFDSGPGPRPDGGTNGPRGDRDFSDPRPRGDDPRGRFGPREMRIPTPPAGLFDETQPSGFYYSIWSRNESLLKQSTNAPASLTLPPRPGRDTLIHTRERGDWREAYQFTEMGDCVLAGRSMVADLRAQNRFALVLLAAGGIVLAFGLGVSWILATRAIRPIEQISSAASRISAGNLDERITVADPKNELGLLAGVLNSTFSRLQSAFDRQKQFTADAAHELRTPLAVLISETQATLARERNAADYRETVQACLETAQQMRRLTDSLLELARAEAVEDNSSLEEFDLAEQTRSVIERLRPLAEERAITIHSQLEACPLLGKREHLEHVVNNLLSNAIYYNKKGGEIHLSTRRLKDRAILVVRDTGIGIGPADLPHVFERFYRADKSRTTSAGRTGLGLAICQAIVDARHGTIEVESTPGQGTTFTVSLPA